MSLLTPEFITEKPNVSDNKAKYSIFYALLYYLKRNTNFLKKFSYTQKSQNKNFYLIDIKKCSEKY